MCSRDERNASDVSPLRLVILTSQWVSAIGSPKILRMPLTIPSCIPCVIPKDLFSFLRSFGYGLVGVDWKGHTLQMTDPVPCH